MLPFQPKRLVIARHAVDYHKQWNGLLGECYQLGFDPYAGDCVVFVKRDRTQLRALGGDDRGLFLVSRRFDWGRLTLNWIFEEKPTTRTISVAELRCCLRGQAIPSTVG